MVLKEQEKKVKLQIPKGTYLTPQELEKNLYDGIIRELEDDFISRNRKEEDDELATAKRVRRGIQPIPGEVIKPNPRIDEDSGKTTPEIIASQTPRDIKQQPGEVIKPNPRIDEGKKPTIKPTPALTTSKKKVEVKKVVEKEVVETRLPPTPILIDNVYDKEVQSKTVGSIGHLGEEFRPPLKKPETLSHVAWPEKATEEVSRVIKTKVKEDQRIDFLKNMFQGSEFVDLYQQISADPHNHKLYYQLMKEKERRENVSKRQKIFEDYMPLAKSIRFEYQEDISRFMLRINDDRVKHVYLSDQISYVLGFKENEPIKNLDIAPYMSDLRGGCSHICVYLGGGILDQMIVGDQMSSLLQIVAVSGKPGEIVGRVFIILSEFDTAII